MSGKRFWIGAMLTVLSVILVYVSHGMVNAGKKQTYHSVAVILDDSSHDRWNALKKGLEQAAEENYIHLNIVFTGLFRDQEEECAAIRRELENGAEGIIVQVIAQECQALFDETVGETPVVLLENDMGSAKGYAAVAPDQKKLGAAVADSVLSGEENLKGKSIGILTGNQRMQSQKMCLEGFLDTVKNGGAEIAWMLSGEEWDKMADSERFSQMEKADVVAALDNYATECAVAYLQENENISRKIYGEGRSEKAVYYLDKGYIEALVVPNGYYMGYRSVEVMAQKLKHKTTEEEKNQVDFLTVTRENLYDEDVEKVLFPITG